MILNTWDSIPKPIKEFVGAIFVITLCPFLIQITWNYFAAILGVGEINWWGGLLVIATTRLLQRKNDTSKKN